MFFITIDTSRSNIPVSYAFGNQPHARDEHFVVNANYRSQRRKPYFNHFSMHISHPRTVAIGLVLAKLLRITSPVSGVIEELPENVELDQFFGIPAQQPDSLFKHIFRALARKSKSKTSSRLVNTFRSSRHAFTVRPFDIELPNDKLELIETLETAVQTGVSAKDVLQMLREQFMRWRAD